MKEAYTHAQISRNNELKDTLILTTGDIGRYIWQHLYTSLPILIILLFLFAWCLKWWYEGCDIRGKKWYQHAFVCGFPFIFETLITFFFFSISGQQKEIWYLLHFCTYCIVYCPSQHLSLEQHTQKLELWLQLKVLNCKTFSASIRNPSVRWESALALTIGHGSAL